MPRILLSPPHLEGTELAALERALQTGWLAPLGPEVERFERRLARTTSSRAVLATSSGTAALHLALRVIGVEKGDEVFCSTLTFVASANPIRYESGRPVFIDSELCSWNLDPAIFAEEIQRRKRCNAPMPKAVVVTDLFGHPADFDSINKVAHDAGIAVVEDAAEALGAQYKGRPAGNLGDIGALSFNGNKIITTSGGGALVSDDTDVIERSRFLASQARESAPHYEHRECGFNYRLSNLLAAVGTAQLEGLERRIDARRANFEYYMEHLGSLPGVDFMPEAMWARSTRWLTCLTITPTAFGATREVVRQHLEANDVEARPIWKPMHLQPLFSGARTLGGRVSETLYDHGLCLPSGPTLTRADRDKIVALICEMSVN